MYQCPVAGFRERAVNGFGSFQVNGLNRVGEGLDGFFNPVESVGKAGSPDVRWDILILILKALEELLLLAIFTFLQEEPSHIQHVCEECFIVLRFLELSTGSEVHGGQFPDIALSQKHAASGIA